MAEFDEILTALKGAQAERDAADDAAAGAREHLKRIAAREQALARAFDPQNQKHIDQRGALQQERDFAEGRLKEAQQRKTNALASEAQLSGTFATFTDPRDGIERLNDSIPILMMPVRLETRFKSLASTPGAPPVNQLWVRVYPDDCWIDSFDPVLSETEVRNAKTYWTGIWKAGGIEDQERAAWRTLATSHGSGRAGWIVSQYQPANIDAQPTKVNSEDVILVIVVDEPIPPFIGSEVATFWREVWLADGDAETIATATQTLEDVLGQGPAQEVITKHQPVNFTDSLPIGVTKDQVEVSVATIAFGPIETKETSWARAPKVNILPNRFVFIGYEGQNATVVQLSNAVPSQLFVGPNPSAPQAEQLQADGAGELIVPEEMKWMTDFDRAVEVGMGFRINLNPTQAVRGFTRVLVVGLRLETGDQGSREELENLLRHHSLSRKGFSLVPQGTPTNNTEATGSGFDRLDDPDQSFTDLTTPAFTPATDWLDKRDGQWVAEYLGIDPALFANIHHANATDQLTARAMNLALWPATLGHWMESMMVPVFTQNGIEQTRDFFNRYVIGAGAIPAIRIGTQPYGILPATTISRMNWIHRLPTGGVGNVPGITAVVVQPDPTLLFLRRLYPILKAVDEDWLEMLNDVSFVGKPGGDPHQILLDVIGLHSGSVEWSQRYAESLKTLFNRLNLQGFGGLIAAIILVLQRAAAKDLIRELGGDVDPEPHIFEKIFSGRHNVLKGGVVDDKPLSETEGIRPYTETEANYIQWLIDAAQTSFDALYAQTGFKDDRPPTALLFILLRHALQLGYHDVSIRANQNAGLMSAEAAINARIDNPFLHISEQATVSESRYQPLYAAVPAITGNANQPLHQFITAQLQTLNFAFYLREQLAALERLKGQSTARLERAFADHVDCCSYRLDSWLLGIVNYQLSLMRNIRDRSNAPVRQGIHLGAYAWLENLRPENKILTPVGFNDPDLETDFGNVNRAPLLRDSTNQGYVHAPSLNHAVAAAVLRNGFISNASPQNRQTMAVNLTSERARTAVAMLEGIRAGQGLADLLGYQFERGLHDRHNLAEVDKFIFKLRKAFPLRADRLKSTQTAEGVSIEAIEARNVIDGLAFVEHMKASGNKTYPFTKPGLPAATSAEAAAINAEADRLLESHDAVADLALAEGVYQAVLGNYDRVASTYDAYARGNFPPEPDIIRTPLNGIGLRTGSLASGTGVDPAVSPVRVWRHTPRAQAEPALNNWLAKFCRRSIRSRAVSPLKKRRRSRCYESCNAARSDLQPADLVAIMQEGNEQAMSDSTTAFFSLCYAEFWPAA